MKLIDAILEILTITGRLWGKAFPTKISGTYREEWLQNKTTIDKAETKHISTNKLLGPNPTPFGYQNKEWERLKSKMQAGDELWEYSSPPETWGNLSGSAGIWLVRNGKVINGIVTVQN